MFCERCGSQLEHNARFCTRCGNPVQQVVYGDPYVLDNLYKKEKVSLYIWAGVVCYQILIGFLLPSAWGFALWNIFACYQSYVFCNELKRNPVGIYSHYEGALVIDIIFLILNIFLGGIIGAAGAAYDLYVRQYALQNRDMLLWIEQDFIRRSTMAG